MVNCSISKLMWQDNATPYLLSEEYPGYENSKYSQGNSWKEWQRSVDYCENLNLGGYSDWRMPNIYELSSVFVPRSVNNTGWVKGFKYHMSQDNEYYWSSTSSDGISNVYTALASSRSEFDIALTRCVRGGVK